MTLAPAGLSRLRAQNHPQQSCGTALVTCNCGPTLAYAAVISALKLRKSLIVRTCIAAPEDACATIERDVARAGFSAHGKFFIPVAAALGQGNLRHPGCNRENTHPGKRPRGTARFKLRVTLSANYSRPTCGVRKPSGRYQCEELSSALISHGAMLSSCFSCWWREAPRRSFLPARCRARINR